MGVDLCANIGRVYRTVVEPSLSQDDLVPCEQPMWSRRKLWVTEDFCFMKVSRAKNSKYEQTGQVLLKLGLLWSLVASGGDVSKLLKRQESWKDGRWDKTSRCWDFSDGQDCMTGFTVHTAVFQRHLQPIYFLFYKAFHNLISWWCDNVFCATHRQEIQSLSHVWLFVTPWTAAHQASLSITNSLSLLKLMSIKSVMPSNHLTLCCPLLLLTQFFTSGGQSIGVSASASVLPMNIQDYFL